MSTLVRRGQVMTPRRQRIIAAYLSRHSWLYHWGDDRLRTPLMDRWGRMKYEDFLKWEREFMDGGPKQTKVGTVKPAHPEDDC